MRESRPYGFVRGALSNERPYRVIDLKLSFAGKNPLPYLDKYQIARRHLCWVAAINASFDVFELTLGISLPIDFR
jgi:hypothetical protein